MSSFSKRAKEEAAKYRHQINPKFQHKYNFACGANADGGGGFQPGNSCAGDGDGKDDAGDQGGGDKPKGDEGVYRSGDHDPASIADQLRESIDAQKETLEEIGELDNTALNNLDSFKDLADATADGDIKEAADLLNKMDGDVKDELPETVYEYLNEWATAEGIELDANYDYRDQDSGTPDDVIREMPKNHRQQATEALKKADDLGLPNEQHAMVEELIDEGDHEMAIELITDWVEAEDLDPTPVSGEHTEAMGRFNDAFAEADPDELIEAYMDLSSEEQDSLGDEEMEMVELISGEPEAAAADAPAAGGAGELKHLDKSLTKVDLMADNYLTQASQETDEDDASWLNDQAEQLRSLSKAVRDNDHEAVESIYEGMDTADTEEFDGELIDFLENPSEHLADRESDSGIDDQETSGEISPQEAAGLRDDAAADSRGESQEDHEMLENIESGDFSDLSKHFEGLDDDQQAYIMSEMQGPQVQDAIIDADEAGAFDDEAMDTDDTWMPEDLMDFLENGEYKLAQEALKDITKRLKKVAKSPKDAVRETNALSAAIGSAYLRGYEDSM